MTRTDIMPRNTSAKNVVPHALVALVEAVVQQLILACVKMPMTDTLAWLWPRLQATLESHNVMFAAEPLEDLACFLMTNGRKTRFVYAQDLSDAECLAWFIHVLGHLQEYEVQKIRPEGDIVTVYELRDTKSESLYANAQCAIASVWAERFIRRLLVRDQNESSVWEGSGSETAASV